MRPIGRCRHGAPLALYVVGVDDALVLNQTLTAAQLPDAVLMTGQIFVENGEAAARTLLVDYLLAVQER